MAQARQFETGATRDTDDGKFDYEGFFSPLVLRRRAEYMHLHRVQSDGKLRDSDNWQKGIPLEAYMKSLWRHFMDVWLIHRGYPAEQNLEESLTAMMFNAEGYLHEVLKEANAARVDADRREDSEAGTWLCVSGDAGSEANDDRRTPPSWEAGMDWQGAGTRAGNMKPCGPLCGDTVCFECQ